ncbi:uncharacterized protein PV09_00693 [Verruconis gallopava]|uniref:RRN7-type domain-containing protein n=1 Tax=Verruconis gallopava TaxID=253628 RepID=A0A0D2AQF4_9PEZI|nr:uncharacterized protein PV09_00693 [Verruconis gallopava]KIW08755.1 hypothetical protein PV09_00693 [Verruconis gallopava]
MADNDYEYRIGDRCGIDGCRSRRYRTNESGFEECARGHQHDLVRGDAGNDEDEFGINLHGKRFRKHVEKVKVLKHLRGKDAFELYLLCYQMILRKQAWWFVHEKKLPQKFETVVHDLWALRLQNLRTRLKFESDPGTATESGGEHEESDNMFGTQDFEKTDDHANFPSVKRAARSESTPNLLQTLAMMYMATQILRLPIFLGDIIAWVESGSLLYYDAIAELPREMIDRLVSNYQNQFQPKIRLAAGSLLSEFRRMLLLYNKDFGLVMPALNVPPALLRLIEKLALPLEVYYAVRRLAKYMKLDFTYPPVTKHHINVFDFPEAQILVCIVITLKIYYGIDGKNRIPTSDTNPAAAIIDWDQWERLMKEHEPLEHDEAMRMVDRDVINLPNAKIDDYLDFFQENFVVQDPQDRKIDAEYQRSMLNLFPIVARSDNQPDRHDKVSTRKVEYIQAMQGALRPNLIIDAENKHDLHKKIIRPGEQYTTTRNMYQETGYTRTLLRALAHVSGLPFKSVARAVVHGEQLLVKLRAGKRSRGRPRRKHLSREQSITADAMSDVLSVISGVSGYEGAGEGTVNSEEDATE